MSRSIKQNKTDGTAVKITNFGCVFLMLISMGASADIASLKLESSVSPNDNYRCGLADLESRDVLHGSWNKQSGCRVQVAAADFTSRYSACWLGGFTENRTLPQATGVTQCRVETFRGMWRFSAHSQTGAIECTFLCLAK